MKAEPSLSSMKEQELKKTVIPFAQMRMKETNLLGPDVRFVTLLFIIVSVPAWPSSACLFIIHHTYLLFTITYHASFTTHHVLTPDAQVMHKFTLQWSSHIQYCCEVLVAHPTCCQRLPDTVEHVSSYQHHRAAITGNNLSGCHF